MIIKIKVKPSSSKTEFDEKESVVYVKARPENNKANIELIKTLSKYYKVSSSNIKILKGLTSRDKVIEIIK
jgi:hypothetical protein